MKKVKISSSHTFECEKWSDFMVLKLVAKQMSYSNKRIFHGLINCHEQKTGIP